MQREDERLAKDARIATRRPPAPRSTVTTGRAIPPRGPGAIVEDLQRRRRLIVPFRAPGGAVAAVALLFVAFALRLALLPLAEGNDFVAFDRLSWLTLHGHDVYAMRLSNQLYAYRALSWTYLPLLLHVFTALQWLAAHTGWSFQIVGKLPIVAADMTVGVLLYVALRRRAHSIGAATLGMSLYLFNPLVLYNGAFYGRFDAVALAFLLLAFESYRTRLFALAYALAISAKTFPLFLAPFLAFGRERQPLRRLALAGVLVLLLALPYVVTDPRGLLYIFHYVRPSFGRLSWYYLLLDSHALSTAQALSLARAIMWLYPLALLLLVRGSPYAMAAQCFALYLVFNQVLYEQYLLWPLPFLIVVGLHERSRLALWLLGLSTVAGMLENEFTWDWWAHPHYHPAPTPWVPLNVALALSVLAFVVVAWRRAKGEPTLLRCLWSLRVYLRPAGLHDRDR